MFDFCFLSFIIGVAFVPVMLFLIELIFSISDFLSNYKNYKEWKKKNLEN